MDYFKKNILLIIGLLVGALGGYLYYHFVGCSSGSCAIISDPIISTVYGSIMGSLFFNMFKKEKKNS